MRPFHSSRLPHDLDAELLAEPAADSRLLDLTLSNPTLCALPERVQLPERALIAAWGSYEPLALGPTRSREAVAALCCGWGRPTEADQVMLTSSSSEALSFIFKMACSPGETVATALPGYPLVPHIAELEGLRTQTFALEHTDVGRWRLDVGRVAHALRGGVRTVVLVSPGNPTGAYLDAPTLTALAQVCNQHGALAVFDEVFAPYHAHAPHARLTDVSAFDRAICVGGLSKAALLPQAKVSWLSVHGSRAFRAAAMAGLEWIGDAFLSLGPVALVLPELLAAMPPVQAAVRARVRAQFARIAACGPGEAPLPTTVDPYTAGWYAVLRPHAHAPLVQAAAKRREHVAEMLLATAQVRLHPGYLFDLPGKHTLVSSLIVPDAISAPAWLRVRAALGGVP